MRDKVPFEPEENDEAYIQLKLGDANFVYQNLEWILDGPVGGNREAAAAALQEISEKNRSLEAENQNLKFRLAVMQDMLAGTKLDMIKLQAQLGK
ncbi:hypothetical protein HDU87_008626 [Geranomyces variabilis]|uniref:Uncharacterized protein n=1 Tax=Geranomyces variabilis TaxID=109894 RepID=A0AAD5XJQ9_9FUNG|nr:hypothetical protein HDU87_008626 [Geranomyces variabilis]